MLGTKFIGTWKVAAKSSARRSIDCFFAVQDKVAEQADLHLDDFGVAPSFGVIARRLGGDQPIRGFARRQVAYFDAR